MHENLSQQQTNSIGVLIDSMNKNFQYEQNFYIWVILILSSMVLSVLGNFYLKEATKERPLFEYVGEKHDLHDQIHHIHHWP